MALASMPNGILKALSARTFVITGTTLRDSIMRGGKTTG